MGSLSVQTDQPKHVVVTEEIEWGGKQKVIARSGKYYAVRDGEEVFAVVAITSSSDGWVTTKLIDEGMGPLDKNCPAKILNLLSPTTGKYALDWRAACRKNLNRPKVTEGMRIRLNNPIGFSDGVSDDTFTFIEKYRFCRSVDGQVVSLGKSWRAADNYVILREETE